MTELNEMEMDQLIAEQVRTLGPIARAKGIDIEPVGHLATAEDEMKAVVASNTELIAVLA